MLKKIAVFASGAGTNAEQLVNYFNCSNVAKVSLIVCNRPNAGVIARAKNLNVPLLLIDKAAFHDENYFLKSLKNHNIDFIVLAGFLWLIPAYLTKHFPDKIVNIHPALLPKYGGKGMYGHNVHKAVISNKESESGITIHFVNEHYDEGKIIKQSKVAVEAHDTHETLAQKIHALEHLYYPKVIEEIVKGL